MPPRLSLSTRLGGARALRSEVTIPADLAKVEGRLREALRDAETPDELPQDDDDKKEREAWVNTGLFLATMLLQRCAAAKDAAQTAQDAEQKQQQDQQQDDATKIKAEVAELLSDRNFAYRLSIPALTHRHGTVSAPPSQYAAAWDDALPEDLLERLCDEAGGAFHPTKSEFWRRHDYSDGSGGRDPSPYFSYVIPLRQETESETESTTTTALIAIIRHIKHLISQNFSNVAGCKYAEFWAHSRPHCSGHQLHFDSDDEGRGGVRNPVVSTVLNLSNSSSHIGGETLVTSQTSSARSLGVNRGWLCSNGRNRLLAFRGDLLHGVVPGPGVPKNNAEAEAQASEEELQGKRRVTFMVAFWEDIVVQDKPGHGSARPFSRVENESWARTLSERIPVTIGMPAAAPTVRKTTTIPTPAANCFYEVPVWEDVNKARNREVGMSLRDVRKYKLLPPYDDFFQFYS